MHWVFGIGGRRLPLLRLPPPGAGGRDTLPKVNWLSPGDWLRAIKHKELGQQDKTIGIAELADAVQNGRPSFPPHDFTLHLTELTLAIQGAGLKSDTVNLTTSFEPLAPRPEALQSPIDYGKAGRPNLLQRRIDSLLISMHRH